MRVAWAGCLAPLLGGCLGVCHSQHARVAEAGVAHSEKAVARQIHKKAHEAWQIVRSEFTSKIFTPEFHDGFIDGYCDYLDRGGDGQPPAVPPLRYTQNRKYYSPEGHVLMRDYFLGFKYGTDVAIATGQRQYLTVPVLIPEKTEMVPAIPVPLVTEPAVIPPPGGSDSPVKPLPQPLPLPRTLSRSAAPRPNRDRGMEPAGPALSKFGSPPRVEVGAPAVDPLQALPTPTAVAPAPLPMVPVGMGLSVPLISMNVGEKAEPVAKLALPPGEDHPLEAPLPPNFEEFRPRPANHTIPPPLPPTPSEPEKK